MTKERIKAALSGYYGFDNFGDEAILTVLCSELKKNDFDVTVFSKNPEKTSKKLGVSSVYTFDFTGVLKTLFKTNILISGGGSLLQDATSIKSLVYYLLVIGMALVFGKNVLIFAQGIGPINNPVCRFFTKLCLKKCKYVTVRDEKSKKMLESWGVTAKLVSDPVWNLEIEPKTENFKKIGIQLRSWSSLTAEYLKNLAASVTKHFSDYEIEIYSFQNSLDLEVCKNFEQMLKTQNSCVKTVIKSDLSVDDVQKTFSQLDYVIAMRYHACLLALKYETPVFALSYDTKVEKLAQAFNLPCSFLEKSENLDSFIEEMKNFDKSEIKTKTENRKFDFDEFVEQCKAD